MHSLGKILLFVNLLASGGFVYLATQDWAKRQTITAAALRHHVVISGIPVAGEDTIPTPTEENPAQDIRVKFRAEMDGGYVTDTVSYAWLQSYLRDAPGTAADAPAAGAVRPDLSAGGTLVSNQLAEVKRVREKIRQAFDAADGPRTKANMIYSMLILQAQTLPDRADFQELSRLGRGDDLFARLNARFDAVLAEPSKDAAESGDKLPPAKDGSQRELMIAHLLAHLDPDAGWQKRVATVVGLKTYLKVVTDQIGRFDEMARRVNRSLEQDQARYLDEYALLKKLSLEKSQFLRDMVEYRTGLQDQLVKDKEFVAQRETQLAALTKQLADTKTQVDQLLFSQAQMEKALFNVQAVVGRTLEENFELEDKLERVERERAGRKGPE